MNGTLTLAKLIIYYDEKSDACPICVEYYANSTGYFGGLSTYRLNCARESNRLLELRAVGK